MQVPWGAHSACGCRSPSGSRLCKTASAIVEELQADSGALRLTWSGSTPMATFVRRIPLLGHVAPAVKAIKWDTVTVYRIVLRENPCAGGYEATVQDAAS